MEGAAVAQVCHDYAVPFAAMRTISDRADDNAHMDFPAFVRDVAGPQALSILRLWLQAHLNPTPFYA
jgi:adenosylhomocysteine nucleosidase